MKSESSIVQQRAVYAAIVVCLCFMVPLLWMPAVLGVLSQGYGLSTGDISRLAFVELAGTLLGTLYSSGKSIPQFKRWMLIACVLVVASNGWLAVLGAHKPSLVARLIAGLGEGLGYGYGLKVCSASARPTRNFGILTGLMSALMIAGFQLTAGLLQYHAAHGVAQAAAAMVVAKWIFDTYAAAAAAAFLIYWTHRPPAGESQAAATGSGRRIPAPLVLIGLLAIGLAFMGDGGVWTLLQTLGTSHGFTVASVANAMSAFAIAGVVGSFTMSALPRRVPSWIIASAALLTLWCGLYALYAPRSLAWYVVGCAVGGFYWNFILTLILGLIAQIDRSGQGSVLGGMMSCAGSALGALLAGQLIHNGDYAPVGWMAGGLCLGGLLCTCAVERWLPVEPILPPAEPIPV
jgi:predicted MFS family arabinose efflux permease